MHMYTHSLLILFIYNIYIKKGWLEPMKQKILGASLNINIVLFLLIINTLSDHIYKQNTTF